jgi:ribosomal protein S24E
MQIPPKNLAQIRDALAANSAAVMDDRRMAVQVKESSNALGKATSTVQVYLEACKMAKVEPSFNEDWNDFIFGTTNN